MSSNVIKIKSRIKSVSGAYKVTSAMKLVSTVKLKKYRNKMLSFRTFDLEMNDVMKKILTNIDIETTPYYLNNNSNKKLYIVISSTLGLCGSYNNNIFKLADASISKDDDAIILGKKGVIHFSSGEYHLLDNFGEYSTNEGSSFAKRISSFVLNEFLSGIYSSIHIIYTKYKNPLTFVPSDFTLLPISQIDEKASSLGYGPLLEPNEKTLLDSLMPMYIENAIFSKLMESEVCEQASRSNAMENATNNAKDILDELKIEFNKARQSAITQEIVEIVSASRSV